MSNEQIIKRLEARAFKLRITVAEMCRGAGVAPSTFSRWKKRPDMMKAKTVGKLEVALDRIEGERR